MQDPRGGRNPRGAACIYLLLFERTEERQQIYWFLEIVLYSTSNRPNQFQILSTEYNSKRSNSICGATPSKATDEKGAAEEPQIPVVSLGWGVASLTPLAGLLWQAGEDVIFSLETDVVLACGLDFGARNS